MYEGNWKIYKDSADEWRWNVTAANGKTIAASSEGYKNRIDCVSNARVFGYTGS